MMDVTLRKKTVGEIIGRMTLQNRLIGPAPSMRAASISVSGTEFSPAM